MTSNGPLSRLPGEGWQQRTLPALAGLAAQDARISDFRVHGSASGTAAGTDRWSDLDVLIAATEPTAAAENLAREIGRRLSPVFAVHRSEDPSAYTVRQPLGRMGLYAGLGTCPYSQAAITAAIRSYATALDEIAAHWNPQPQLDNRPLLEPLDAVDQQSAP